MASNKKHQAATTAWEIERLNPAHTPWYARKTILEHRERYRYAEKFVKDKVVVELGCGTGYGSYILAQAGAKKVIATDIDPLATVEAKKHWQASNLQFRTADAMNTQLSSRSADVVISFEMLEHVMHPEKVLQETYRLVKPGGMFIMSTPNAKTSYGDNPYHLKEFTAKELKQMLYQFSKVTIYGQRKVHPTIMSFYMSLSSHVHHPTLRQFLRFRPWEGYDIFPLDRGEQHVPLYLIALCKK